MATTININDAAAVVRDAEHCALKSLASLIEQFVTDLDAILETLPTELAMDASRLVNDAKSNVAYIRTSSLPQALFRYEPNIVPAAAMAPTYPLPPLPVMQDGDTSGQ